MALKPNQPTLYQTLEHLRRSGTPLSQAQTLEHNHNRLVHRQVWVYAAPENLQSQWAGLQRLIWVERWGMREGKPFAEQVGYISDLELQAAELLPHI